MIGFFGRGGESFEPPPGSNADEFMEPSFGASQIADIL